MSPQVHRVAWWLRIACAWCFIGHGFWGLYRKPEWLPLYDALSLSGDVAWATMPLVGLHDIALGLLVLAHPTRALFAWMTLWCLFTAWLRPLAGLGWWEFVERAGNFTPPFALWLLASTSGAYGWLERCDLREGTLDPTAVRAASIVLRIGIGLLLIGHGAFAAIEAKPYLVAHWAAVGVDLTPEALTGLGAFEIALGVAVLLTRSGWLLAFVAGWKVIEELLYPIAGGWLLVFEFLERGGDYFAPLALIGLDAWSRRMSTRPASLAETLRAVVGAFRWRRVSDRVVP